MNQRDKTLWIVGDSYGTFDTTNDTHWANQFAEYKECNRILNLSRGGFDTKAISYTALAILDNHQWAGREFPLHEFDVRQDILLFFSTTSERFCHLHSPEKEYDPELSIANLNWHINVQHQKPMPFIEHMPKESNMFSQNYLSVLQDFIHKGTIEPTHIKSEFEYFDWKFEEYIQDQLIHGIADFHNHVSTGSEFWITNYNGQQRKHQNYIKPYSHYVDYGELETPDPDDPEYVNQQLCNHLTPEEHNTYWQCLLRDQFST